MKTVFTTSEAARICKVSQQTIIRCFDNGQLMGFRVPGSRFRRIPREALRTFMVENGIPTDEIDALAAKESLAVWIDPGEADADLIKNVLMSLSDMHRA